MRPFSPSSSWTPLRLTAEDRVPRGLGIVILLMFVAVTLYTGIHHEPWRDEADAWLAARDLILTEMVPDWTAHAGTPALWYLVLKLIVHSGLPYRAETIVNLLFIWTAAAMVVFAAPLTRMTKILLLGSYFFSYEYAVIARSYALSILLIFLALALRKKPIPFAIVVAALFNTNIHGAIFAALLYLLTTRWSQRLIMTAGAALAAWQLWPRGEGNPLAMRGLQLNAVVAFRDVFVPFATTPWAALLSALLLGLIAISIRTSRRALLFFITALIALVVLYTAVWFGGLRASGMILVAVIASIWIADRVPVSLASKTVAAALNLTLLLSGLFALSTAKADVSYAFSGSKEMAAFIDHRFDGYDIAAHNLYQAESLLPWLPQHKFFYLGLGEYGTYLKWNAAMRRGASMSYEAAVLAAKQHFTATNRPGLLLLNAKMPHPETFGFHLVHATPVIVFRNLDERYWLYAFTKSSL